MTVAAVNLSHQPPAIRQADFHDCADGAAAGQIQSLSTAAHSRRSCQIFIKWQAQAYSEEGSPARASLRTNEVDHWLVGRQVYKHHR